MATTTNKPIKFKPLLNSAPTAPVSFDDEFLVKIPVPSTDEDTVLEILETVLYTKNIEGTWGMYGSWKQSSIDAAFDAVDNHINQFTKYHEGSTKKDHVEIVILITETTVSNIPGETKVLVLDKFHKDFHKYPPKKKVFINGPNKDKEFLAKVGKQYNHS